MRSAAETIVASAETTATPLAVIWPFATNEESTVVAASAVTKKTAFADIVTSDSKAPEDSRTRVACKEIVLTGSICAADSRTRVTSAPIRTVVTAGTRTEPCGTRRAEAVVAEATTTDADADRITPDNPVDTEDAEESAEEDVRTLVAAIAAEEETDAAADAVRTLVAAIVVVAEAETTAAPSASSAVEYAPTPYLNTPYSIG